MDMTDLRLRAGDWIQVKSPQEIAQTLDAEGALDGLPFMPEMLEFCGRRFRVARLAEKTCVEYPGVLYKIREFRRNNVVILDAPRCSGADHGGCQRSCVLFWKTPWLRKTRQEQPAVAVQPSGLATLRSNLKVLVAPGRYYCQSTQLDESTQSMTRGRVLLKCLYDIRSGSRGFFEMIRMVVVPIWRYVTEKSKPPLPVGELKRTPVGDLNLQPGEWVTIKSEAEIVRTLDSLARTRGLSCDRGMRTYCGGTYRVSHRLDRMISEATGELRPVQSTVVLEGLHCLCWWNHVGGCPREDFMYWREVWLDRAERKTDDPDTSISVSPGK
jgi:hypothetical protein